ncbi:radical SAM protein [Streptomyces sp. AV19]|uniref:radical SAM/SPASM domain-containing protein n=1 Tax=Streptomyces sp. AV19 TaxID=2793068 RepID=UPI0018FEACFC|nr:radical SAM protein [Streptomyces sp. AV19]MBH1937469.1 radical SAM protein [Streptomyces sp. AV19]MDG4533758.1 radical SAM protein [Streptomyces sp. AV19]
MDHATTRDEKIERMYRSLVPEDSTNAVSVIMKLRGETCDIDCLYCYEKRKEAPGGARIGPGQVRDLARIFHGRPLAVELHGGEPLTVGREQMADILTELARQPSVVRVNLQTNGVLLDDAWLDLFDELCPGIRIGVSLDGDARGNAWRVGYDGEPVYPRVAAALRLLAERGRRAGVIAAVTPAVLGRAEAVLDHIAGFGSVDSVSFVPCFDSAVRRGTASAGRRTAASRLLQQANVAGDKAPNWAIRPSEYADFVLAAAAHWISAGHFSRLKLEPVVSAIRRLKGLDTGFCHFSDLKCDHVFTLYPDGRLGSCDELPWPQARLTLLHETRDQHAVAGAQRSSRLLQQGRSLMERCTTCDYRDTCGGGCVATRWRYDLAGGQDAYCDHRMRLVDGIAALLAQPSAPRGARCRTLRWRPRRPNSMADVEGFLARWHDPRMPRPDVRLRVGEHGNINTAGLPGVHEADDLDPHHPLWEQAIEPGAKPLVAACTRQWGCVTYDSCAGHAYEGTTLAPVPRRVGLLPRDRHEYAAVAAALCRVVHAVTPLLPPTVEAVAGRADLTCEKSGRTVPVLDLVLRPVPGTSMDRYFAELDAATASLAEALAAESPDADEPCACVTSPGGSRRATAVVP